MKDLSRNGYTHEEVLSALLMDTGTQEIRFRYDLLDYRELKKDELYQVSGADITQNSQAEIKRTAKFSLQDENRVYEDQSLLLLKELPTNLREW